MALITFRGQTFDPDQMINGAPAVNVPGTLAYEWNMAGRPNSAAPVNNSSALQSYGLSSEAQQALNSGVPAMNVPGTKEYDANQRQAYATGITSNSQQLINTVVGASGGSKAPYPEFSFDEAYAKQVATAEYSPYYQESLTNFITDKQTQLKQQKESTDRGLGYITGQETTLNKQDELYRKTALLDYENAIKQAQEGYAGRGLSFSGIANKGLSDQTQKYQTGLESYGLGQQQQKAGLEYQRQGLTSGLSNLQENNQTAIQRQTLDTERLQKIGIDQGVQNIYDEKYRPYQVGMINYYKDLADKNY